MAIVEVRSPWTLERATPSRSSERIGVSPRSAPRSDNSGHLSGKGYAPLSRRDGGIDPVPAQGTGSTAELEKALDGAMRRDRR
jgi:hypothetical protein